MHVSEVVQQVEFLAWMKDKNKSFNYSFSSWSLNHSVWLKDICACDMILGQCVQISKCFSSYNRFWYVLRKGDQNEQQKVVII